MRTLIFNVKRQTIAPNTWKDIGGLVAGSEGYVRAKFDFSSDWNGCKKVAGFFSVDGKEFPPKALDFEDSCIIPKEALEHHEFDIVLYGKKNGYSINTRPFRIKQYGGKK